MSEGEALERAIRQRMKADSTYAPNSNGIFAERAPSGTPLPYTTFKRLPGIEIPALQTSLGWKIKVQMKHWGADKNGKSAIDNAQLLSDSTRKLFHARTDAAMGTNAQGVLDALNALSELNGWKFTFAAIAAEIPPTLDKIGDKEAWCQGHVFEFWLTYGGS